MTQRYYQPAAGRFTQFDPLPESVMLPNRYEYAGCNPSNFVDPSGLHHDPCAASTKNLIGTAIGFGAAYGAWGTATFAFVVGGSIWPVIGFGVVLVGAAMVLDAAGQTQGHDCY